MKNPLPYFPRSGIIFFLGTYVFLDLLNYLAFLAVPEARSEGLVLFPAMFFGIITCAMAFAVAGLRIYTAHPIYNYNYFHWLRMSPWRPGLPLPMGSLSFNWKDLIVIFILILFSIRGGWVFAFGPPIIYVALYIVMHCIIFIHLAERFAFSIIWASGLIIFVYYFWPAAAAIILLTLYIATVIVNNRIMEHFPWSVENEQFKVLDVNSDSNKASQNYPSIESPNLEEAGWPSSFFLNLPDNPKLKTIDGVIISLLLGWWSFILIFLYCRTGMNVDELKSMTFWISVGILGASCIRVFNYMLGARSPMGPIARLINLRLILPKYDIIFIPSLCVMLLSVILFTFISSLVTSFSVMPYGAIFLSLAISAGIAICSSILICAPPSLFHWRLIGHYRHPDPSLFWMIFRNSNSNRNNSILEKI